MNNPFAFGPGERVQVPAAMTLFPAETPADPPPEWAARAYNIMRWTPMPRGGHFSAGEEPDLLASARIFPVVALR